MMTSCRSTAVRTSHREIGVEDLSLQKLYANFFGQKISKAQRLTNWEADILNEKQKQYAATDAWACIMLYEELQKLEETGRYELVKEVEENKNIEEQTDKGGNE